MPHNALPIDAPELVIPLFPFVSLAKFNKKLTYLIHKQSKMRYRLKTVIGVYRHGDRYPKQKSKIAVTTPEVCDFFFDLYNLNQNKPEDISINEDNQEGLNTIVEKFSQFLESHSKIKEYAQLKQLIRILQARPQALKF